MSMGFLSSIKNQLEKEETADPCLIRPIPIKGDVVTTYHESGDIFTETEVYGCHRENDCIVSICRNGKTTYFDNPKIQRFKRIARDREITFIALKNVILRHQTPVILKPITKGGCYTGSPNSLKRVWIPAETNYVPAVSDGKCVHCTAPFESFEVILCKKYSNAETEYKLPGFGESDVPSFYNGGFTVVRLRCIGYNCYNSFPIEALGVTQDEIDAERVAVEPTVDPSIMCSTYKI